MIRFLTGCSALLALTLLCTASSRGDEPPAPRDDALDRLLEKLDKPSQPTSPKPESDPAKADATKGDAAKAQTPKGEAAQGQAPADGEKKPGGSGTVAPKDQALDSLLEKLGETKDDPKAKDERRGGQPMPPGEPKDDPSAPGQGKPDQPKPSDLTGKSKDLDEHLEELTGRRRKRKQDDEQNGEGSGPLSKVIKEMREVEQRLGKPDTGEETRKKQSEIVKNLEQLIEQMRNSSSQSKGQRSKLVMQPGQQPGGQAGGQQPGANPGGAPNTKPAKPDGKHAAHNNKDVWGHLPEELRQEMDNVAKEAMLPSREELIKRYYLSVSKKSMTRGD